MRPNVDRLMASFALERKPLALPVHRLTGFLFEDLPYTMVRIENAEIAGGLWSVVNVHKNAAVLQNDRM